MILALWLVCLVAGGVACNRGPAEVALAETDAALAAARPQLAMDAPSELAQIEADRRAAATYVEQGQYTKALGIAQRLPGRVALAAAAAASKRQEALPAWSRLSESLPPALATLEARIGEIESGGRRPRGLEPAQVEAAKAELGAVRGQWARAEAAFRSGNPVGAVTTAEEARLKATALSSRLNPPAASGTAAAVPRHASTPREAPPVVAFPVPADSTSPAPVTSPAASPAAASPSPEPQAPPVTEAP